MHQYRFKNFINCREMSFITLAWTFVSTRHGFTIWESRFQKFLGCFVIFSISMRPNCAHNFRINDPAILIQTSYFITDFKESKYTNKKISKGAKFGK